MNAPARHPVRPLDLTGRARHLRTAMGAMSRIATQFTRAARRTLPFLVRQRAKLAPGAVSLSSLTDASGEGPTFHVFLECDDGNAWGELLIDPGALALMLEGALGARNPSSSVALGQELTLAQRALVARVARSLAEDFARAVREEAGLSLAVVSMRALPSGEAVDDPPTDGLYVSCAFEGVGGQSAVIVALSAEALEAAAREHDGGEEAALGGDPRIAEAMKDVPVALVAELGRVKLNLKSVLGLKVGDVLRLTTAVDDSVTVRVGSVEKLLGAPVVSRGQLAVEVRGRHGS